MGYGWIWFNQHHFGGFIVSSWNFNLRFSVVLEDVSQQKSLFYSILTPKTEKQHASLHRYLIVGFSKVLSFGVP